LEALIVNGGYPLLFIIVILEGIPLVGTAVPGHISIIAAGFLSRIGVLDLYWVLIIAIVGALIGDFIGFTLGRRYGLSLIARLSPYFFIKDSHIARAKKMLDTHTGKAMFFGRFSPITRALMPFLVGTGEISAGKFWLYNILGGVSWVVSSVLLGYVFGAGYHAVAGYFGKFAVAAILLSLLIAWGYRFINSRFHIFARYELITLGLNIVALVALAKTIQDAWAVNSFMANFDVWVSSHIVDPTTHLVLLPTYLVHFGYWITTIGGTAVITGLGVLFGFVLLYRKRWRIGSIFLISMVSTAFSLGILKEFFMRVRPEDSAGVILGFLKPIVNDPSFPSGHAGMAAAFFVVLTYFLAPKISSRVKREFMIIACVLAVFAIGLSRIVLNVHWTSDVIAGWSLGVFMATGSILLVRYLGVLIIRKKDVVSPL
jgi:undecaprenyl-diphosphatase